jgi:zeta-carotene desaturase
MLTIFMMFAAKTEASRLNLLAGSPDGYLTGPIVKYIEAKGAKIHLRRQTREILYSGTGADIAITGLRIADGDREEIITADKYLAACDVPGIQRLLPSDWRSIPAFDRIYQLEGVPVATVQLRFDGWVTELRDKDKAHQVATPAGIDNLLYSADADFSCFADLALTSPKDYYREGQGSLLQCVLTPGDKFIPMKNEDIVAYTLNQVHELFPSAREMNMTWSSVVKLAQSLYREAPGKDPYRPSQKTPVANFFLAGSYTQQDYIDSMEGATISGMQAAQVMLADTGYRVQGQGLFNYAYT